MVALASQARERGCVGLRHMSTNESQTEKDPLANDPTPSYDVPGITDLSELAEGDRVVLETFACPFEVIDTASRQRATKRGHTVTQRAVALESTRHAGGIIEVVEQINGIDGSTIELVDRDDGTPVRLFAEADDE